MSNFERNKEQSLYDRGDMLANIMPKLQDILTALSGGGGEPPATEATLQEVKAILDDSLGQLQSIDDRLGTNFLGPLATEATLGVVTAQLATIGNYLYQQLPLSGGPVGDFTAIAGQSFEINPDGYQSIGIYVPPSTDLILEFKAGVNLTNPLGKVLVEHKETGAMLNTTTAGLGGIFTFEMAKIPFRRFVITCIQNTGPTTVVINTVRR